MVRQLIDDGNINGSTSMTRMSIIMSIISTIVSDTKHVM